MRTDRDRAFVRRSLLCASLLPAGLALQLAAVRAPELTEQLFSRDLGPRVQGYLGLAAARVPFSVSEFLLFGLVTYALGSSFQGIAAWLRRERGLFEILLRGLLRTLAVAGPLYLWFLLAWGLNYARPPFADNAGLDDTPPRPGELERVVTRLLTEANVLRGQVQEDDRGVFRLSRGRDEVLAELPALFDLLGQDYPFLAGPPPISRRPLLSPAMTMVGISGIFSPFTGESHVNGKLLDHSFVFAAFHEAAHRRGIAREDEANFVAWRACMLSEDPELRYPGVLAALDYALADLSHNDPGAAVRAFGKLAPGIRRDSDAESEFWSPTTETMRTIRSVGQVTNDLYLKSQGQEQGTATYRHMVRLLIAQERSGP